MQDECPFTNTVIKGVYNMKNTDETTMRQIAKEHNVPFEYVKSLIDEVEAAERRCSKIIKR